MEIYRHEHQVDVMRGIVGVMFVIGFCQGEDVFYRLWRFLEVKANIHIAASLDFNLKNDFAWFGRVHLAS